jgi:hypothetical protein
MDESIDIGIDACFSFEDGGFGGIEGCIYECVVAQVCLVDL